MWYRESGVTILYDFRGREKSLRDHLEDLFPGANSVEIFYLMNKVRAIAKKKGISVVSVLDSIVDNGSLWDKL